MKRISGPAERVVVVGAGLAGLAAAAHLTGRGRSVTVLDDREGPGGRASGHQLDGYSIDTGPTVLTMPGILGDTFAALGEELGDWLELTRLDPAYRASSRTARTWTCTPAPRRWPRRCARSPVRPRPRATSGSGTG